jgi:hypothetical protein
MTVTEFIANIFKYEIDNDYFTIHNIQFDLCGEVVIESDENSSLKPGSVKGILLLMPDDVAIKYGGPENWQMVVDNLHKVVTKLIDKVDVYMVQQRHIQLNSSMPTKIYINSSYAYAAEIHNVLVDLSNLNKIIYVTSLLFLPKNIPMDKFKVSFEGKYIPPKRTSIMDEIPELSISGDEIVLRYDLTGSVVMDRLYRSVDLFLTKNLKQPLTDIDYRMDVCFSTALKIAKMLAKRVNGFDVYSDVKVIDNGEFGSELEVSMTKRQLVSYCFRLGLSGKSGTKQLLLINDKGDGQYVSDITFIEKGFKKTLNKVLADVDAYISK